MRLQDRIVFITGASSGIGRSCAHAFAQEGARLILAARRMNRLEALAQELFTRHQSSTWIGELDVRDHSAVEAMMNGLPEEWRNIDILVNNAGLSRGLDKLYEGTVQDWEEMLDTNVKGLLYVTAVVVPGMVGAAVAM